MFPGVAVPPDQAQIRRTHETRPGSLRRAVRVLDPRPHGRGHARRTGRVALRAAAALGDALRGAPDRDRCDRGSDAAHAAAQARRPGAGAPGGRHRAGECRHPPHAAAVALGAHRSAGCSILSDRRRAGRRGRHARVPRPARAEPWRPAAPGGATWVRERWVRPPGRWTFALWQAGVWSGVGRQFEPWFLNPATWTYIRASNTNTNVNSFLGFDVERRGTTTAFGQFMLDDIQVSRKSATDLKPASYAFTIGAKGRVRRTAVGWQAFYTQVANLTYRNEDDLPGAPGCGTGAATPICALLNARPAAARGVCRPARGPAGLGVPAARSLDDAVYRAPDRRSRDG